MRSTMANYRPDHIARSYDWRYVEAVRTDGETAVRNYAEPFDGLAPGSKLVIGKDELRLVTFKELLMNCSDEDVKKLSTYEKDRIQPHRNACKRLYEQIEAEEEDVSDLD